MFYAYIIESISTTRWYYGSSGDVHTRLNYHNKGWNQSTKGRGPWKLIFVREFEAAFEAREFEVYLKRVRNKQRIKSKFKQYFK